jgi:hypothetical protein
MKILKTVLTALLVLTLIFTADVYGLSYEASNHYELKNIILEQMKEYNTEFNIRYTGSLDNIKEVLEETVNSDIYLNSNVSRVDWNISGTKTLSNIKVKVSYILTRKVTRDGVVSYDGAKYGIPWQYRGREVRVRIFGGFFEVYYGEVRIARHRTEYASGRIVWFKGQYQGLAEKGGIAVPLPFARKEGTESVEIRPLSVYDALAGVISNG